jgi:hypothetical protein
MTIKDLFITPAFLLLLSMLAYFLRPFVTTPETRKYFMPALLVRFAGAILLGLLYQFYYGGGDTFNYFTHGSRWIWEAFREDLLLGFKLLLEEGGARESDTFKYSQHIWYYKDEKSFFVVRIAAFFDLLTFHTYSATALFFAAFSFSGLWAMYSAIVRKYRGNEKWIAIAILFVPSVVFWGSGILKDTITLGALGWLTYAVFSMLELKERSIKHLLIIAVSSWLLISIKFYILLSFLPGLTIWLFWKNVVSIRNVVLKALVFPMIAVVFGIMGFILLNNLSKVSDKYAIDQIAERAAITAYDIRYGWGARDGGDGGYDIGLPDGSWQSLVRLMPAAINVSLFRPYLWEIRNPLMLLAAAESVAVLGLTLYFFIGKKGYKNVLSDPFLVFCLTFALLFAFAVGVSTFNFGTLMRYKIPLMSFFILSMIPISNRSYA